MKKTAIKMLIVFLVFFAGTAAVLAVDGMCFESTGEGGELILDIGKVVEGYY